MSVFASKNITASATTFDLISGIRWIFLYLTVNRPKEVKPSAVDPFFADPNPDPAVLLNVDPDPALKNL